MLHSASAARPFLASQRMSEMKFGAQVTAKGARFRLWAPHCGAVKLKFEGDGRLLEMQPRPRGWYELEVEGVGDGTLYRYVLEDGRAVPDPASRFQPQDVTGPSEVIDPRRFGWTDVGWVGRPWEESVIYELHVGTFTPEGTFRAVMNKLDYLVDLGVTTLQIMPVNDFPGRWNWGYDGVLPFAPESSYGRPDDLKALVDTAHGRGLNVMLDVVHNHFGPKGNFLPMYAPVLTDRHSTPWGEAVNFDGPDSPTVRELVIANARYWLNEYHFDGLRLDAVHEIRDDGFNHVLHDLAIQLRGAFDGRILHLVLENEENEPQWLRRTGDLVPGLYNAQWNDDLHHLIDAALHDDIALYVEDYGSRPGWLGKSLATGFGYQGEPLPSRDGEPKGGPSAELPPVAFVDFIQNHDQIGNRLFGERIASITSPAKAKAAAAVYLLSPHIPMLFMGEEWGATTPFVFFSDIDPELAEVIRTQRAEDLAYSVRPENLDKVPPDPMSAASFRASKLRWSQLEEDQHRDWQAFYRKLIALRRDRIVPLLAGVGGHAGRYEIIGEVGNKVEWQLNGAVLTLVANLSDEPIDGIDPWAGETLWIEGSATSSTLAPWSLVWSLKEAAE